MTTVGHRGLVFEFSRTVAPPRSSTDAGRRVVLATVVLLSLGIAFAQPAAASPVRVADAGRAEGSHDAIAAITASLDELARATDAARVAWDASADRVLEESSRRALEKSIVHAETVTAEVKERMIWPLSIDDAVAVSAVATITETADALDADVVAVDDAVDAWTAEQKRLAAEAEARRKAEEAAAAAAASGRSSGASAPRPTGAAPSSGVALVEGIWTSGGQAQIDACRGSVNVAAIASYLGGAFYAAEHWGCGGSAWGGLGAGALVQFPGYGTYQVAGRVGGLAYGADASALPSGYAGYYQTCIGGSSTNMTVWLLTRVG